MIKTTTTLKENTKKSPIDSEIVLAIFLMLIVIVVPLAITIWDIGTPIPGYKTSDN
jgi:hypothetical protein